jgi:hypothetical protein
MRMVNPTLSTIQNKHPLVAHPLPPPPKHDDEEVYHPHV